MLLLDSAIPDATERVDPTDFYDPRHQVIFTAIAEVYGRGIGVDAVSVADAIERSGGLKTDDYAYLLQLAADTPVATNAEHYADIVAEYSQLRKLAFAAATVRNIAYSSPADVPAALDEAEATITAAVDERTLGDVAHVRTEIDSVVEGIYRRSHGIEENGVASNFKDLDGMLGGFRPRQLIVIGARPAMGKTALSIELALAVARQQKPVLFTSLEMGRTELQERFIATMSMVSARTKEINESDHARMKKAATELRDLPIEIDENPAASVLSIKGNARRVARRNNGEIGMVIVDYLQLMTGRHSAENRQVEVAEMSRQLKALAGELGCPVVALSQLSRGVESRLDKRPMLADLRESGAIEQDADVVMFLYRDEVYNTDSKAPGTAEVIVAKHRNGPTGAVRLAWMADITKFASLAKHNDSPIH